MFMSDTDVKKKGRKLKATFDWDRLNVNQTAREVVRFYMDPNYVSNVKTEESFLRRHRLDKADVDRILKAAMRGVPLTWYRLWMFRKAQYSLGDRLEILQEAMKTAGKPMEKLKISQEISKIQRNLECSIAETIEELKDVEEYRDDMDFFTDRNNNIFDYEGINEKYREIWNPGKSGDEEAKE